MAENGEKMRFTTEKFTEDLERLVSAGERREKVKIPHKLLKSRLSAKKPFVSINEKDYSMRDLLTAIKRDDPLIKKIVDGGIEKLNELLRIKSSMEEEGKG